MKTKLSRWKIVPFLLFVLFVMLASFPAAIPAQPSGEVYVYSYTESHNSKNLLRYFDDKPDWEITQYDLDNSTHSDEFLKIANTLVTAGVQVVPPGQCMSCLVYHYTWEEIYLMFAQPLALFFRDGTLTAITVTTDDYRVLDQALVEDVKDYVKILTPYGTLALTREGFISQLGEVFPVEQEDSDNPEVHTNIYHLLPLIIVAAAVDAINPCEFYVLVVFLSFVFFRIGRKGILRAGIAFSVAIFIIYYFMGFGLLQLISYVQEARLLIVILGFSVGLRAVLNFIFGVFGLSLGLRDTIGTFLNRKIKRVPGFFSKRLSAYLKTASENPITAFAIGIVASVFLLPCTSGPYLIALSLIADLRTLFEGLFLLAVYNGIIMTPFLAITLGIYMLKLKTSELKKWSSRKMRWLNLVAGLLMILLSLYLLFTIIP